MTPEEINAEIGNIDLFLLDKILKGRFKKDQKILDAGCGEGRNMLYFLKNDYDISAFDQNPSAIKMVQMHARTMGSNVGPEQFQVANNSETPFSDNEFDYVLSFSVLHFATNWSEFEQWVMEISRVLKPGGFLLLKMDAIKGVEDQVSEIGDGLFRMADSSIRYLLTDDQILWFEKTLQFEMVEPVRYEISHNKSSASIVIKSI